MKKRNELLEVTFQLALKVIEFSELLEENRKYVIARQLLKSGTAVGANSKEAQGAESRADFIHKLAIAQKECNESIYWLELLVETNYLGKTEFESINGDAIELLKMLTSIIKTTKSRLKKQ